MTSTYLTSLLEHLADVSMLVFFSFMASYTEIRGVTEPSVPPPEKTTFNFLFFSTIFITLMYIYSHLLIYQLIPLQSKELCHHDLQMVKVNPSKASNPP